MPALALPLSWPCLRYAGITYELYSLKLFLKNLSIIIYNKSVCAASCSCLICSLLLRLKPSFLRSTARCQHTQGSTSQCWRPNTIIHGIYKNRDGLFQQHRADDPLCPNQACKNSVMGQSVGHTVCSCFGVKMAWLWVREADRFVKRPGACATSSA